MPFTRAVRATTTAGPRTEWGVQLVMPVSTSVKAGDVILAHFWLRCVQSMTGEAFTGFVFEESSEPFDKSTEMRVGARRMDRSEHSVQSPPRFQPGEAHICFRLGYERQSLEIGGIELTNYGPNVKIERLPRTRVSYTGREADAAWRTEASRRIEKIRKGGSGRVASSTRAGKPIEGATVTHNKPVTRFASARA